MLESHTLVFHNEDDVQSSPGSEDGRENVVLTPECIECHRVWQPSDHERWEAYPAYVSDDEPPEVAFYCPECAARELGDD
jgi:hypothetical protein